MAVQEPTAEDAYETAMVRVVGLAERIIDAFNSAPSEFNWGHVGSLNTAIESLEVTALIVEQAAR